MQAWQRARMSRMALLIIAGSRPAMACVMLRSNSSSVAGLGLYTRDFKYPHKKKSSGFKSGERAGQSRPI